MKKLKIIVLGSGLVGAPMALDLAKYLRFEVSVADLSVESLKKCAANKAVKSIPADLSDPPSTRAARPRPEAIAPSAFWLETARRKTTATCRSRSFSEWNDVSGVTGLGTSIHSVRAGLSPNDFYFQTRC